MGLTTETLGRRVLLGEGGSEVLVRKRGRRAGVEGCAALEGSRGWGRTANEVAAKSSVALPNTNPQAPPSASLRL